MGFSNGYVMRLELDGVVFGKLGITRNARKNYENTKIKKISEDIYSTLSPSTRNFLNSTKFTKRGIKEIDRE